MTDPAAFRLARSIVRERTGRPGRSDRAYGVYLAALLVLIVGTPLVRAAVLTLAEPRIAGAIDAVVSPGPLSAVLALLSVALVVLGRFRGPVLPREPFLTAFAASPLPRRLVLRGAFTRSAIALAGVLVLLTGILATARLLRPDAAPLDGVLLVPAAALIAVPLALSWLCGQVGGRLGGVVTAAVCGVALLQCALVAVAPTSMLAASATPWAWIASLGRPGNDLTVLDGMILTGTALAALLAVPLTARVLDRLRIEDLVGGARRWSAATTLLGTGDVRAAAARLGPQPRLGRRWRWLPARGITGTFVQRDLIGLARIPLRLLVGAAATAGVGAAIGLSLTAGPAVLAAAAVLGAYLAAGAFTGGLRAFGQSLGGSSPYGISPRRQAAAQTLVPFLLTAALLVLGAGIAVAVTGAGGLPVLWALLVAVLVTSAQVFAAAKGPLPIGLLMPVPSPVGDLSSIQVAIWLADAVLLVGVLGGAATFAAASGAWPFGVGLLLASTAVLTLGGAARLSRATRP